MAPLLPRPRLLRFSLVDPLVCLDALELLLIDPADSPRRRRSPDPPSTISLGNLHHPVLLQLHALLTGNLAPVLPGSKPESLHDPHGHCRRSSFLLLRCFFAAVRQALRLVGRCRGRSHVRPEKPRCSRHDRPWRLSCAGAHRYDNLSVWTLVGIGVFNGMATSNL